MKKIISLIIVLAILTGIFFFVRFNFIMRKESRKQKEAITYLLQKQNIIEQFLSINFPDQVKIFNDSLPK
jgi:Tfp pilus assembly protein PilE